MKTLKCTVGHEIRPISVNVLKTQTIQGYFERFYEILEPEMTHKQAWEQLEEERMEVGFTERYSSYESFRNGKCVHRSKFKNLSFVSL